MDKTYNPRSVEEKIYQMWEAGGYFIPRKTPGKRPFSILLPPPNANADLHLGHAMYVVEDIMVRYRRMIGNPSLWLPGADHAGFETQYVFEKHLAKEGKSRFDYPREELYKMIWDFVHKNRGAMENQLRRLGFSLDWSRNTFTLDPKVVAIVYKTFKKLYDDGLVYRDSRLVNYCTHCGTSFSDLEVKHVEQTDPLYFMNYGPLILATVRPETKFGDTAVAVNPKDKRYTHWVGEKIEVEGLLGKLTMQVIADSLIDPSFGTGVAKVTPAHDMKDFDIGKRHDLPMKQVIGFDGRLTDLAGPYAGMKVKAARTKVAADLEARGLMDHVDKNYTHTVSTCYKCGTVLEPLPLPQWYVKIRPLADASKEAIKKKKISFVPKRFERRALQWLGDFHDWNISRQIVWGIRIPAWKCQTCSAWTVTDGTKPTKCISCSAADLQQDTDTFDTWFSSGQWPFATLQATKEKDDFTHFYPTSVMETGYDILPWWICRMIMLGLYVTGDVPFRTVYLHGLVRDAKGQKMSKSKGNVINPLKMIDQYGADALRMALVYGTAAGNDQALSEDKIRGMRNFANKLWNIGRFIEINTTKLNIDSDLPIIMSDATKTQQQMLARTLSLSVIITRLMNAYRFSDAANKIYDFTWHVFADKYIEQSKKQLEDGDGQALAVLIEVFKHILKLLHPFMPFITEEIWSKLPRKNEDLLIATHWPTPTS